MKSVREQVGDAERYGVAGSRRVADFNQAGGRFGWDGEGEARGAAHCDLGRNFVDEDGRRTEAVGAEMGAVELDFTKGKSGGGEDVVDVGIKESGSTGFGGSLRHMGVELAA
jgi:hypothetical protein